MTARTETARPLPKLSDVLPRQRGLYYDGRWQEPSGGYARHVEPGNRRESRQVGAGHAQDVDAAARAAHRAFKEWHRVKPLERGALLKRIAAVLREHAEELALLDAANCGNPVGAMVRDVHDGAAYIDFFAGLVTELKGDITPMGEDIVNLRFASRGASVHASSRTTIR
jgi:betaine-aldehyde dehydrogenase